MLDPISTAIKPPRKLGDLGSSLWESVQAEYRIDDAAGIELLMQACAAADRIARLSEMIDRDGEMIETKNGPRAHPALREELSQRRVIFRAARRFGPKLGTTKPGGPPTPRAKRPGE